MPRTPWTRDQKIALFALLFVALTCAGTIILVPEVRRWIHLESSGQTDRNNSTNSGQPSTTDAAGNQSVANANQAALSRRVSVNERRKSAGLGFATGASVQISYFQILVLDLASYNSGEFYLKLRICNTTKTADSLQGLFIWYTPKDQDSVSWVLPGTPTDPLVFLKPGECRAVGNWSEKPAKKVELRRPLGVLHFSRWAHSDEASLDLDALDSQGIAKF